MNNITYAKRLLENYSVNKAARENYPHEMIMINSRLYSSCAENTVVEMIHAKDLLTLRTEKALREIQKTERALEGLSEYEKDLLSAFYITRIHSGAEAIAGRYSVERSTVYRDKNKALKRFAESL
jgi:DNA-directed RNA polymerase specialized sigma subunit